MNTQSSALLFSSLVALTLAGCASSTDDATLEVGVASESSALQAEPGTPDPAAPAPAAPAAAAHPGAHVRIKVKEIRIHVAGSGEKEKESDDDAGAGWVTVFSGDRTIELDRNIAVDSILGSAHASAGKITQVRLILDGQATLIEKGVETPIACGSCDTSGLKIIPKGNVRVESGAHHHFVVAFDIDRSLVDEGGELRLKPVLRLAQGK